MPDTVTLVLDAEQYYSEIARITSRTNGLSRAGENIGGGFVRGERVVRTAAANITQGLLTAGSAADAAVISLQSLERVFKIGIGLTVFTAAAIAAGAAITGMIDKTAKLNQEILKLRSFGKGSADFLGVSDITQNIEAVSTKIKELQDGIIQRTAFIAQILRVLGPAINILVGAGAGGAIAKAVGAFNASDQGKIDELIKQSAADVDKLTSKQNDLNRVELERLQGSQDISDLDKLEIEHKERLGKLAQLVTNADLAGTVAAKLLLETENDRYNIAVKTLKVKQQEAQTKALGTSENFLADVGSGRFLQAFREQQKVEQDAIRGAQIIAQTREGIAKGTQVDPALKAELQVAERLGAKAGTGLSALLNADYSNLLILSKYDFSGLAPLSNLTIQIQ